VRLPFDRIALKIAHGLPHLGHDRAIRRSMKADGLNVRTD
jgi:hypothetical protein